MARAVLRSIAALATALFTITPALAEMPQPYCAAAGDSAQFTDRNTRVRGVFAGQDGWLSSPGELQEDYETPDLASMGAIVDALAEKGTKLVVVAMPMRPLVYPEKMPEGALSAAELEGLRNKYHQTIAALRSVGAIAPDNLDVLVAAKEQGDVYFARDHHWTPFGAKAVAQAIGDLLKQDADFPGSNLSFVDGGARPLEVRGSFLAAVESLCNDTSFPSETMQFVETTKSQEGVGLFTEEAPPQIALAGTSFSRKAVGDMYNFGGSIEHATGEEVLNVAINGGGSWSSITAYLSSEEFHANPPAYLIWETSNVFGKPDQSRTSQVLGSIQGSCAAGAVFNATAPADMPLQVMLDGLPGVSGPGYHMEVNFTDPDTSSVGVSFSGSSGSQEIELSMPDGKRDGKFFAQLPHDIGSIGSLVVTPKSGQAGDLRVAVCSSGDAVTTVAQATPAQPAVEPAAIVTAAQSGSNTLAITLFGEAHLGNPILAVEVNGRIVVSEEITSLTREAPQTVSVTIPAGAISVRLRLANDLYEGRNKDRNLQVTAVSYAGQSLPMSSFQPANSAIIVSNGDLRIRSASWIVLDLPATATQVSQGGACEDAPGVAIGPFTIGSTAVPPSSSQQISQITAFLQANPACQPMLTGFSTPDGNAATNLQLARTRAENTAAALAAAGVESTTVGEPQILTIADQGGPVVRVEFTTRP